MGRPRRRIQDSPIDSRQKDLAEQEEQLRAVPPARKPVPQPSAVLTGKPTAPAAPVIAPRVFVTRDPEAMERIRHGHAVLGAYTNNAGATVITSGSTDWAHGLAGRDPQIERITRNVLGHLG